MRRIELWMGGRVMTLSPDPDLTRTPGRSGLSTTHEGASSHAPRRVRPGSGQQLGHHPPVHVRQAELAALEAEGQALVIEPEQVQDRGVQVVLVDGALDRA